MLRDTILKKIEQGKATMRPRWHFVVRTFVFAAGVVGTIFVLFFFASFILFILRQTGLWFVPIFGFQGVRIFLMAFPWILILLTVALIVVLEVLLKRYEFAYKRPLLYSVLGIIALVAVGGFLMAQTPFHGELYRQARYDRLPVAGSLYHGFGLERLRDVHPGTVEEITEQGFLIKNRNGETITVFISGETRFPLGLDFREGDMVVVLGERTNGTVQAIGIRKIDPGQRVHIRSREGLPPPFFKRIPPPAS